MLIHVFWQGLYRSGPEGKNYWLFSGNAGEGKVEIDIRPERGNDGKGKYGRWLGVVYLDGEDVNEELVREGHAEG